MYRQIRTCVAALLLSLGLGAALHPTYAWTAASPDLECNRDILYVVADQSTLHSRPSLFARTESLEVGLQVCVIETRQRIFTLWHRVRTVQGAEGWISASGLGTHREYLAAHPAAIPTSSPEPTPKTDNGDALEATHCTAAWGTSGEGYHIRSGPDTSYTTSGQYVTWGEKVCVLERIGNWVHLQKSDGTSGYTHQDGIAYQPPATLTPTAELTQRAMPTATPVTGSRPTADLGSSPYHTLLSTLTVAPHTHLYTYDRDDWGSGWSDVDRDCQNTRHEVLELESREAVTFRSARRCQVVTGLWMGPWSGETFTHASDLDIDHHVPLKNAHISGGATWSSAQKRAYYNDMQLASALQATKNSLNRAKSAQGPEAWQPPLRHTWCRYARDWIEVKAKYSLSVTQAEKTSLESMLDTCGSPDAAPPAPLKVTPVPTLLPVPTSVSVAPATPNRESSDPAPALPLTNGYRCSTAPYRHLTTSKPYVRCSDFANRTAFDAYYEGAFHTRHDRDKDCLPCESLR